jgi:hypothetical protein
MTSEFQSVLNLYNSSLVSLVEPILMQSSKQLFSTAANASPAFGGNAF